MRQTVTRNCNITAANIIESPKRRRTFLIKLANKIIKDDGRSRKKMFDLRNLLRKTVIEKHYTPIMDDLAKEIEIYYRLKEIR